MRSSRSSASGRLGLRAAVALMGLIACGSASGQTAGSSVHPLLQDRWMIQLGAYRPNVSTTASLNGSGGVVNRSVSFEDDLNLSDRESLPAILASVRLGERWRIEAEYFSLDRSGSRAVSRTINWGDNTYTAGTVVSSEFNSDVYRLSVGYSFIKNANSELGVALGAHVTDFKASLSAAGVGSQTGDALAPLPTLGLYGAYALSPQWLLFGRLDYFSLKYEDYDGSLVNFFAGVDFRFARHFGVGLGYRHVDYDVDVTKTRYTGNISYKFSGPLLYLNASF